MKKKVKVLYFIDRLRHGGIQQFCLENIKYMDRSKVQIDFLLLDDGNKYPLEKEMRKLGCKITKIDAWINKPTDYIKHRKNIEKFFKENHDYKVVHMHSSSKNYMVLKYAKKYGIPVRIAHAHNINFQTKNKFKQMVGNVFKKPLKKYATNYFACAYLAGEWLFGKEEVEKGNVTVIHNAVDYEKFKPQKRVRNKIRKELNITEAEIVFGNVGRFDNQKNHTFLIDIFKEINKKNKNTKLLLIGIGPLQEEIKQKVKDLKLQDKVIFAGFIKNVNDYMQAMDAFIMPSLYEGLPVTGVEAQASGLPCFMSKDVITEEVKITKNLTFISLNESAELWAKTILNSDLTRKDTKKELKEAGYFIKDTAKELVDFYLKGGNDE